MKLGSSPCFIQCMCVSTAGCSVWNFYRPVGVEITASVFRFRVLHCFFWYWKKRNI